MLTIALPSLATGLLLWMGHFPVACGWLAWVALVPLLCLVRTRARMRWALLGAWVAGISFFVPALQWMRIADDRMYFTWIGLAVYCSLYLPLAVGLLRLLARPGRLPLLVAVPVVWTGLEFVRGHLGTGFAWYLLAHSQHDFLPLVQVADLTGAYGVSFLVALVNAVLFAWLCRWPRFVAALSLSGPASGRRPLLWQTGVAIVILGGTLSYGHWRLGQDTGEPGPVVALIQSNLPQRIRNAASVDPTADPAAEMAAHNARLSDRAWAQLPKPDLIVWPETSYPAYWSAIAADVPAAQVPLERGRETAESLQLARDIARLWPTNLLIGMNSEVLAADQRTRRHNSAILIRPTGTADGRYDKIHRVPFGEYVPFRDWLPWLNALAPYDFDYSIAVGDRQTRFSLGGCHFGVLICYEDSDPDLARGYLRPGPDGPAVDFLINMSNDGWFGGTSEHEEHLAVCRFRAIECRRAVARAVNMGISAVIDGNGRVRWPDQLWWRPDASLKEAPLGPLEEWSERHVEHSLEVPLWSGLRRWLGVQEQAWFAGGIPVSKWARFKKAAGVLTAAIPIDRRESLYVRWGDWLPWSCWLVLGLWLLRAAFFGPKRARG